MEPDFSSICDCDCSMRQGYFVTDKDSTSDHIVVNRIVGLRDSWAKAQKK